MSFKHTKFETASYIDYAALTTSYQTVLDLTDDAHEIFLFNSTDGIILVELPQVVNNSLSSITAFRMPATSAIVYDGRTNQKTIPKGPIKIKYTGTAPTLGEFSVGAVR